MFEDFVAYMNQFHSVEKLTLQMNRYLTRITLPKKYVLIHQDIICNYVYFLEKGLMRAYYIKGSIEVTTWVLHEQQFVTAVQSFYSRSPSREIIETLEPCTVIMIHYEDLMKFCYQSHDLTLCLFKMLQHYSVLKDMRNYLMKALSATERYEILCKQDPDLIRRTPLKIVASYLDISQETLSRIRKQLKERNDFIK